MGSSALVSALGFEVWGLELCSKLQLVLSGFACRLLKLIV